MLISLLSSQYLDIPSASCIKFTEIRKNYHTSFGAFLMHFWCTFDARFLFLHFTNCTHSFPGSAAGAAALKYQNIWLYIYYKPTWLTMAIDLAHVEKHGTHIPCNSLQHVFTCWWNTHSWRIRENVRKAITRCITSWKITHLKNKHKRQTHHPL